MPARGHTLLRDYSPSEHAAFEPVLDVHSLLGKRTLDIFLNNGAYWRNIPEAVWEYTIGGYQVLKKWLSYREQKLLKRPLHLAEVREFTNIARRIAALLLLGPALNANYEAIRVNADSLPTR